MKRPKLVVIDDDPDVQDLLVGFFRPKGYEIVTFDGAEEGFSGNFWHGRVLRCGFFSDLRLPKMSGMELTQALLEKGITTPIIIMTAHRSAEIALKRLKWESLRFCC